MKIINKIFIWLLISAFCYCLGFLVNCFVYNSFVFAFNIDLLSDENTLIYSALFLMIIICCWLYAWYKGFWKRNAKNLMKSCEKDNFVFSGLEQAHFQTKKELKKNFQQIEFDKLSKSHFDGIPIKAEQQNNKLNITFSKPAHTLVIGTTGSGKTTTFINPTIQILAHSKDKPSMLISDPKGELYALHLKELKRFGYDVKVIDLRNPYCSVRWNPLERPYLMYQEMLHLENNIIKDENKNCYYFNNKTYFNYEELLTLIQVKKQEMLDEIYEDLHDIVSVLCPVINKGEPIWESGARNFILAITLAMLEDSENPNLNMTKERFNFYNIMKIATNTQNDCFDLIKYFAKRSPLSKSVTLSKQVLDASDKTRGSYLSTIFDKLAMFSDKSICALTSANEIDFGEIVNKPTALFLQIPDEKETRHTLASMIILQAYKSLVAKANTYDNLSLPRSVYFILDEFGNLPRVHKLEQMITVGRSRKIWLVLVIQSYAQLNKIYDDKCADIIRSNCNIQVFIGTTDLKTINDFSKLCGNYSIVQRNVSFSSSKENDVNSSASIKERPLIYPTELAELNNANNMGNAIVSVFGFPPIRSKFTPSFKVRKYRLSPTKQEIKVGRAFMEESVFYDMLERNKLYFGKKQKGKNKNGTRNILVDAFSKNLMKVNTEILNDENKADLLSLVEKGKVTEAIETLTDLLNFCDDDTALKLNIVLNNLDELKNLEKTENDN